MSNFTLQILYPVWIGIIFNLMMVVVNMSMPWEGPIAAWYFDKNGCIKIMTCTWAVLLSWSAVNGYFAY